MATVTAATSYGTSTAATFTGTSLASDTNLLAGRAFALFDNTSNLYIDYSITLNLRAGTTPTANTQVEFWVAPSEDGTIFAGGNGNTDANKTHTAGSKAQMTLLGILPVPATTSNVDITLVIPSLLAILGNIPRKGSGFIVHNMGAAANSTGGSHFVTVTGIKPTSA